MQEIGGTLGVGGGDEHEPLVGFQHLEPRPDIGCMVLARLQSQPELSAKLRGTKRRNKLLARIPFIAPALPAEITVEARRMASPMRGLVRERGVIAFSFPERLEWRHLHMIGSESVTGAVAAVVDPGTRCEKERPM